MRLENRANHLKGKRDQSYLGEAQVEGILQQRINGRDYRLDGIVQQMAEAECKEDAKRRFTRGSGFGLGTYGLSFSLHENKKPCHLSEAGPEKFSSVLLSVALLARAPNQGVNQVFD